MGRFLKFVGILALLAWTGLGLAAWMLVKDRLQITIADGSDAVRQGDARIDVLSGQVENLQADLAALTDGLNRSLQGLADVVMDADAARNQALERSLQEQLAALRDAVSEPRARGNAASAAPEIAPPDASALGAASEPAGPDEPIENEVTASEARDEGAPTAPAKRRGFLAIELPSRTFAFDAQQAWDVVPSLSRVGFDAKSTLHDFTGVTSDVRGGLELNLAHPDRGVRGEIRCASASLTTGLEDRDANMGEHLAIDEHAAIAFEPKSFEPAEVDEASRKVTGTVTGSMTIRGVTRDLSMPVTLTVDKSLRLGIEGEARLEMSDYSVPVPNQLGVVAVEDEVKVWINLRLRAKAASK